MSPAAFRSRRHSCEVPEGLRRSNITPYFYYLKKFIGPIATIHKSPTLHKNRMTSVVNILNELAASLGHEAVRSACLQFAGKKVAVSEKQAKPIKEKKPRGPNGWTEFVTSVLEELQAEAPEGTKVIRKQAMEIAGERWAAQKGPEALKAYHERKKAKAAAKAEKAAGGAGDASESEEEGEIIESPPVAEKKPRGRPPKEKAAKEEPPRQADDEDE